jgi:predicted enzyme related to lactoylglutathione lyase
MSETQTALQALNVAPSLTASDLQHSLRFYKDGLGFEIEEEGRIDGEIRYYMLKSGHGRLAIGQDDFAKGRDRVKGVGLRIWITAAQDIAVVASRVKAAGFALDSEPAALPWGPTAFNVTDPDGFKLTIASAS